MNHLSRVIAAQQVPGVSSCAEEAVRFNVTSKKFKSPKEQAANVLKLKPLELFRANAQKKGLEMARGVFLQTVELVIACTLMAAGVFCPNAWSAEFGDESKDFGVSPMSYPKGPPYNSVTPLTVPGGKTVTTDQLKEMLAADSKPVIIDALAGTVMIEGAQGLGSGIGEQRMVGQDRSMFPRALAALTGGDKSKQLVFYCRSSKCWHSYNAALHPVAQGYANVFWYRGGIDAWQEAGGKTAPFAMSESAK